MSCNELCCSEFGDEILTQLYTKRLSIYKIAELCRCSHTHIWNRLNQIGVKLRSKTDYPSKGRTKKRSKLWKLTDKELFETEISTLMERYGMNRGAVTVYRYRRRHENSNVDKEI